MSGLRRAAIGLFALITILSLDLRHLTHDLRAPVLSASQRIRSADRAPGYAPFLAHVRAHTQHGDTIALVLSPADASRYEFAYYRASYLLAGRRVIPLFDRDGQMRRERVAEARYLALFRQTYAGPGEIVWRGADGLLVRQQ